MRITRATIAQIQRLKSQGWTHLAIAAEVGCSERTVRSVLAGEHALQPRQLRARGQRLARGETANHPFPCPGCRTPITALPCPACHVTLEQRMAVISPAKRTEGNKGNEGRTRPKKPSSFPSLPSVQKRAPA